MTSSAGEVFTEVSLHSLKQMVECSDEQSAMQSYRDHAESGKHDSPEDRVDF